MPRTVTARFDSEAEAERALAAVTAEVPLRDSAVLSSDVAGALVLDTLQLTPEDRAMCEQQLSKGGFLLVAQVATESRGEAVVRLLDGMQRHERSPAPADAAAATEAPAPAEAPAQSEPPAPAEASAAVETAAPIEAPTATAPPAAADRSHDAIEEERIPLVEEELRIGKREVVRGQSRVHTYVVDVPVEEQVELLHEETNLERRPVNRRLSEEEVAEAGLLQERVVEITEMREEAVVTKEAFVREELVVSKTVHRRVEQIRDTVRRTEVETERLEPHDGAPSGR